LIVIPKHFFVPSIIEKRRPLRDTARRAGWGGSNIILTGVPESGRIYIVRSGQPQPRALVRQQWERTSFLADEPAAARGWLVEVMHSVESLRKPEFQLDDVYADEQRLQGIYPGNRHVREKIRQQLQALRDRGYLEFLSRGRYRMRG
jgi:type II restriction enzyme